MSTNGRTDSVAEALTLLTLDQHFLNICGSPTPGTS